MRYAIYIPPNTKDLAINLTMVAYGNRQNATAFARANNSDLLRALKHLMDTRLKLSSQTAVNVIPNLSSAGHKKACTLFLLYSSN